jgi:hypothetical protein
MSDIAQLNLREPDKVDWDNYGGKKYTPPPPAVGPDGQYIEYVGVVGEAKVDTERPDKDKEGQPLLTYLLDPIKIKSNGYEGQEIRFTRASVRPFEKNGAPIKGNPNKLANYLRSTGVQAKPQTNSDYQAAVRAASGKSFTFTLDWEAYNSETGESIKGFLNFPEDPDRPGQRKSILKKGDLVTIRDRQGNVTEIKTVESEVLFANARLKFFKDAAPRRG